jgi:predicted small lipoprotein YifL
MRFLLIVCALFVLAGCGKKGNLYLPDEPAKPASTTQSEK